MTIAQNELQTHVFKDTGKCILLKKVSPLLAAQVRKACPPPEPPLNTVMYGDTEVQETNEADPDYQKKLDSYNIELESRIRRTLIRRGCEIPGDEKESVLQEVNQLRNEWLEDFGQELDGDDTFVYVSYICIGTENDFEELMEALMKRGQATPKETTEAIKLF